MLDLGAICNFGVLVLRELAFLGVRMIVMIKDGLGDASNFGASPIFSDSLVLLEDITW